jgi:hypothetical protein
VFFPSFSAMVATFDEIDNAGTPLLEFLDVRCEDQRTKQRYQDQLCCRCRRSRGCSGPQWSKSVAITGSDPLLPSGSDFAILFECKEPLVLEKLLMARSSRGAQAAGLRSSRARPGR